MQNKTLFKLFPTLALILVLGTLLIGPPTAVDAQEPSDDIGDQAVLGTAFTYQGQLKQGGTPVNGTCTAITFKLYDQLSSGTQIGPTVTKNNVQATDGFFSVELDFGSGAFTGDERYLEIEVNCGAGTEILSPRQKLTATPYALGLRPGATIEGTGTVLTVNTSGSGSRAISGSATGGANPAGVYGTSSSSSGRGVFGEATNTSGSNSGVRGETASTNSNATGVFGLVSSSAGTGAGVKGQNNGTGGYGVWGQGGNGAVGVLGQTNSASDYGVWAYNSGSGTALRAEGSGNLIEAWDLSPVNLRFRVDNDGNVTADGTYTSPAADFAEMLPATGGLEASDVLVIAPDGNLTQSTQAYQSTVVGVYSTEPGFLGGAGFDADLTGKVPLALVGIVPVKASAENGDIQPGDMLVASDTPGHAMRAGANPPSGTIIGKAMARLDEGTGVIKMLVILQ
jgi:hypothetical protein